MKRNKWSVAVCAVAAALALTACGKKSPADNVKHSTALPKAGANADKAEVAFIDIDTLAAKYEYCIEGQKALEAKQNGYRSQLEAKGQALQNALAAYQKKMQNGEITTEAQAQAAQTKLQNQQAQLLQLQSRIEGELVTATQAYHEALRDSLRSFLSDFNSDGRYKMILSRSGDNILNVDKILYADKSLDITNDVVAGLNKRYKKK